MTIFEDSLAIKRDFFNEGYTRSWHFREGALHTLAESIKRHEEDIVEALNKDFSKSGFETYATEIGTTLTEIRHLLRHLRGYMRPRMKVTSMTSWPSFGRIYPEPYGVALIISPWNYPFYLTMAPLVGAIAAGNCAVLKPSELSPNTSAVIEAIIDECFEPRFVSVVQGDAETAQGLLSQPFDYIFYTGSTQVGKIVMGKAAENLVPVTLELGGKSPCIVDNTADLRAAARRIAWGKFLNAGQTCVAPDYALVHTEVMEAFLAILREETEQLYGENPLENPDYAAVITEKHFQRLEKLQFSGKVYFGGGHDVQSRKIEPTVLVNVREDSPVMQEEIFGPILPVLPYETLQEAIGFITRRDRPLALYLFSNDRKVKRQVIQQVPFGGGCINQTIMHLTSPNLPFGGVGASGMGQYMGKYSFETFSHYKSILYGSTKMDIKQKYPPYTEKNLNFVKKFMK